MEEGAARWRRQHAYADSFVSRRSHQPRQWRFPGDSIPFVMEYIVVESWDQFDWYQRDLKTARPTAIGRILRSNFSFSSSSPVDFTCSTGIHHSDAKPY